MAIDAYSLCPGGTGKKIKFCCGDFLPELQKIDRMVEGEQYLACLKHIDHLLQQEPGHDRACLLASKCALLRATKQYEAAQATATAFLEKHPDNQIALAELAIHASESDACKALGLILRAIRVSAGNLAGRVYQAIGPVVGNLLREGFPLPARALLQLQLEIVEDDERTARMLAALCQATDIPLLLRDDPPLKPCPENVPWKARFDETIATVAAADWQSAADRLTALAADVPDSPAIWRNLATVRGWLADNAACADALRKYAVLRGADPDGLEDAVEAEAEALFLSNDPLGDRLEMLKVAWAVNDVDRAQEAFLSSPRFQTVPFDPAQFSDGQTPPPKAAYMLLDRPMPESAEGLSTETVPRLLGQAMLFGRQTDREARLEVMGVVGDELSSVTDMVRETAADAVNPQPEPEVVGHWSASQKLMRAAWQPPRDTSPEQLRAMMNQQRREAILDQWPDLKLGLLDGRSPHEAAADPTCRVRLLAAILVLEFWSERVPGQLDFNELRAKLDLPLLGPIDPRQQPLDDLPTFRLGRLNVESLSDEELIGVYYRAGAFNMRPALKKFAEAMVARPSLADSDERVHAYTMLAQTEEDVTRALEYVDQGRRAAEAKNESSASWDLMELSFRFAARDGKEAMRLIEHLQKHHLEEPGVGESLTRMLVDVGLLRPDGTPAFGPNVPEPAMSAADEPASAAGGLWTPDSAEPGGGDGGGKLWTPD